MPKVTISPTSKEVCSGITEWTNPLNAIDENAGTYASAYADAGASGNKCNKLVIPAADTNSSMYLGAVEVDWEIINSTAVGADVGSVRAEMRISTGPDVFLAVLSRSVPGGGAGARQTDIGFATPGAGERPSGGVEHKLRIQAIANVVGTDITVRIYEIKGWYFPRFTVANVEG